MSASQPVLALCSTSCRSLRCRVGQTRLFADGPLIRNASRSPQRLYGGTAFTQKTISKRITPFLYRGIIASFLVGVALGHVSHLRLEASSAFESNGSGAQPYRSIRLSEVQKHGEGAERKWITRGTYVYDITDWIAAHPGGDVILRAAGGAVDKYWDIFSIHKKQEVYDILENYLVGEIDTRDLKDGKTSLQEIDDPFGSDPSRDARLYQHTQRPCNAETPTDGLQSFLTPNHLFYVRNHLWVPSQDEAEKQLVTIELPNGSTREYSLEDLRKKFTEVKITATLQCSGNRRRHMTEQSRSTLGLQWGIGAISTAEWTGVRLRDVLADAGFPVDDWPSDTKHAQFLGSEAYGASIPIEKAVDPRGDVLIAYGMNGEALPRDHGFPFRMLVPGYVAARSVKWIKKIVLSDEESNSQWQRRDYKCFGPNVTKPDWDSAPAIQETPVQSAITSLREIPSHDTDGRKLLQAYPWKTEMEEDWIAVEGYCFAGGGRAIARVDVSADNGRTWHQAEILPHTLLGHKAWAWRRWRYILPKSQAGHSFVVKAIDEAYNCQPDSYEPTYNFRGNLTCSWHRVPYRAI